jgi:hypothetical protein
MYMQIKGLRRSVVDRYANKGLSELRHAENFSGKIDPNVRPGSSAQRAPQLIPTPTLNLFAAD